MRRNEKEITKKSEIEAVIYKARICRLGLSDNHMPYIVPMCFGYQDHTIYLHSSLKGHKISVLKKNNNVCFEFDINTEIVEMENACDWGMNYQSVVGFGKASFIYDMERKRKALNIIMYHYAGRQFHFPENAIKRTAVIEIKISSMTGKQSGFS